MSTGAMVGEDELGGDDPVEAMKRLLGADTDIRLAATLGVERSTIAQWRRRGAVPARYQPLLKFGGKDTPRPEAAIRHGVRRQLYGDSDGRYLLAAALAFIPTKTFSFAPEIGPGNIGWSRETRIISVVQVILNACQLVLGRPRCSTESEFIRLMNILSEPEWQRRINHAVHAAAIGEL